MDLSRAPGRGRVRVRGRARRPARLSVAGGRFRRRGPLEGRAPAPLLDALWRQRLGRRQGSAGGVHPGAPARAVARGLGAVCRVEARLRRPALVRLGDGSRGPRSGRAASSVPRGGRRDALSDLPPVRLLPAVESGPRGRRTRGIQIVGDMPIYVAYDSADVWAHPELFALDERGRPDRGRRRAARLLLRHRTALGQPALSLGCACSADGYAWWIDRIRGEPLASPTSFASTTSAASPRTGRCPPSDRTALNGRWVPGPGPRALRRRRGARSATAPAGRRGPRRHHAGRARAAVEAPDSRG